MKVGEFFVQLGVTADSKNLKDFVKNISSMTLETAGAIAAISGVTYKLGQLASEAINASIGFEMFTSQTGLSWQELQKWQIAAELANVSAESVSSSITGLQRQLADISMGRGNAAPFMMLGINPRSKNAFEVLDQLREKIRGMDSMRATNLITQMGLSPDMMQVLRMSNSEFSKLTKTYHGLSSAQEQQFIRAKRSMTEFGLVIRELGTGFLANLLMGLEKLIKLITELPGDSSDLIATLVAITAAIFPMTAAIAALLLLLEDLSVYAAGGESLTGEAIKGLQKLFSGGKASAVLGGMANNAFGTATSGIIQPANMMKNISTIVNNYVNISGAASPLATGREAAQQIKRMMKKAQTEKDNQGY
jgi:hypothetical protein